MEGLSCDRQKASRIAYGFFSDIWARPRKELRSSAQKGAGFCGGSNFYIRLRKLPLFSTSIVEQTLRGRYVPPDSRVILLEALMGRLQK